MNAHAIDSTTFSQLVASVLRQQLAAGVFGFGVVVATLLLFGIVQTGGFVPLRSPLTDLSQRILNFGPSRWANQINVARIVQLVSTLLTASLVTTWIIINDTSSFVATHDDITQLITSLIASSKRVLSSYAVCFLIFGIIDLSFQRISFRKISQMTPLQKKSDQKDQWGAPEVLARRRQLRNSLTHAMPEQLLNYANLLIDDGETVVALLSYDPRIDDRPILLAKARGEERNHVILAANALTIPIVVNDWLATRLVNSSFETPLPVELEPALAEAYATFERQPPSL
jgi:flagellar biosynthetic protein FlhB